MASPLETGRVYASVAYARKEENIADEKLVPNFDSFLLGNLNFLFFFNK
jgi:hypothetical protein